MNTSLRGALLLCLTGAVPAAAQFSVAPVRLNVSPASMGAGLVRESDASVDAPAAGLVPIGFDSTLGSRGSAETSLTSLPPSRVASSPGDLSAGHRSEQQAASGYNAPTSGASSDPALLSRKQSGATDADQGGQAFTTEFRGRKINIDVVDQVLANWRERKADEPLPSPSGSDAELFARGRSLAVAAYAGQSVAVPDAAQELQGAASEIAERRGQTPPQPLVLRMLEANRGGDMRLVIEQLGPVLSPKGLEVPTATPLRQGLLTARAARKLRAAWDRGYAALSLLTP